MDVANVAKCALQIIRHLSSFSDVTRWCQSVATEKAVVCSCSSMVAILSNISIPFITDRNKEMLKTSKLHPAAFAASVCYNCYSTIYGQAYSLYRSRPFACGRDSMMNPQHIRGHNVNAAISPQYAEGSSALGARPLVALLQQRTRPGVTLSWTSAQGSAPKYPTIMNIN